MVDKSTKMCQWYTNQPKCVSDKQVDLDPRCGRQKGQYRCVIARQVDLDMSVVGFTHLELEDFP